MTLSILATQASPAAASPATAANDETCESSQDFATVLQQEGQQDVAVGAEPADQASVADPLESSVETEETVAALVSALLGAMPTQVEAIATSGEVVVETADAALPASGDETSAVSPSLSSVLLTLAPSNTSLTSPSDSAGIRSDMAITESEVLPPGGKALPAWSMLLQPMPTSKTDASAANASAAVNLATGATVPELGVDTASPPASFDTKAFQSLLRSEPMLAGFANGTRSVLDSASVALNDAASSAVVDTSMLAANQAKATAGSTTGPELMPGLPLRSPAFGTLLANQVLWQAKVGNNEAAIRLDPPELGPIDVRISQVENETHLHFTVGHGLTRDQLEQAVPRLRELFNQGGLSLGQVLVEQGSRDNASQRDGGNGNSNAANARATAASEAAPVNARLLNGLIDDYA